MSLQAFLAYSLFPRGGLLRERNAACGTGLWSASGYIARGNCKYCPRLGLGFRDACAGTGWHDKCHRTSVNSLKVPEKASSMAQVLPRFPRIPASPGIRERLRQRGVPLAPPTGEAMDLFEARIETGLMAIFRDHRGEAEFTALYDYSALSLQGQVSRQLAGHGGRVDPKEICQDVFVNVYR
ncbi:MAG: hypothetical protein ACI9F9_000316, partial [Candidatus Paceibacteria bacterium]